MKHPYEEYETSKLWGLVKSSIEELVENNDMELFTPIEYVVGYICKNISYPNKKVALRAAEAMGKKHGVHFSVYKCAWCDGWHIGKNAQNKIKSDALENKALVSEGANKCLMFDY